MMTNPSGENRKKRNTKKEIKLEWKDFQRECSYRKWKSFGHYDCKHPDKKFEKSCPRIRFDRCPIFLNRDSKKQVA